MHPFLRTLVYIFFFFPLTLTSQNTEFYGMTSNGGKGVGNVFRTNESGFITKQIHSFGKMDGKEPWYSRLCEASNGKLYGVTRIGGQNDKGTIYSYDIQSNKLIKEVDFGGIKGANPYGGLIEAANGKLYGMTALGGANNQGVIYEYDPVLKSYVVKFNFSIFYGARPNGRLFEASNGKLYGMTGDNNSGAIFEYDIQNDTVIKRFQFGGSNGAEALGSFIEPIPGKLYGMTKDGGPGSNSSNGVIFSFDIISNTFSTVHSFNGGSNGSRPYGSLIQATDGSLYGLTSNAGNVLTGFEGTLFKYRINSIVSFKHQAKIHMRRNTFFNLPSNRLYGATPFGDLIEADSGKLYGLTYNGGALGNSGSTEGEGVLFVYDINSDTYDQLHYFSKNTGKNPRGSLMKASNGKLYGTTTEGGNGDVGVLFEFDIALNSYTVKKHFGTIFEEGALPNGSLIEVNTEIYGMTSSGGNGSSDGTIFSVDSADNGIVYAFEFDDPFLHGSRPQGSLLKVNGTDLFGLTAIGGSNNDGVIFKYDYIQKQFSKLADLEETALGRNPTGSLIKGINSTVLGLASNGGDFYRGTLFNYSLINGIATKLYDFGGVMGQTPAGSLIRIANDKIVGACNRGGEEGLGVIFQFDESNNAYQTLYHFYDSLSGYFPSGNFVQASNGLVYGTTLKGGTSNNGVLFSFNPYSKEYLVLHSFNGTGGEIAYGKLIQASDGSLYGMTRMGGIYQKGVLFEYNIKANSFHVRTQFNGVNGSFGNGGLLEKNGCFDIYDTLIENKCGSYFLPSGKQLITQFGKQTLQDTITRTCGANYYLTIELDLSKQDTIFQYVNACNTFTWLNGKVYTKSTKRPVVALSNSNGCDTLLYLDLTINKINIDVSKNLNALTASYDSSYTHQWLNCDSSYREIVGATDNIYLPEKNGNYACEITQNGCVDTSYCISVISIGLNEYNSQKSISLYPNPVEGMLIVDQIKFNGPLEIVIVNLAGQEYFHKITESVIEHINTSEWPKGIYIFKSKQGSNVTTSKIIHL